MSILSRNLWYPVVLLAVLAWPGYSAGDMWVGPDGTEFSSKREGKGWRPLYLTPRNRAAGMHRPPRDRSPARFSRFNQHIREAAQLYRLPEALIRAVMHVESNFDPDVVSVDGAMGLMQLMPKTARSLGLTDPFEPRQNILGGARFLRVLANEFEGDLVLTVAGYNAGQGAVERYGGVPPYRETRRYVKRVIQRYYRYKAGGYTAPSPAR